MATYRYEEEQTDFERGFWSITGKIFRFYMFLALGIPLIMAGVAMLIGTIAGIVSRLTH